MFSNYLKIAIRNLIRQRGISFINIFGLSVSLAATLLLLQFVRHELSFDSFHENKHRIYRVISTIDTPDGNKIVASLTTGNVTEELTGRVHHIDRLTKIDILGNRVKYNENFFEDIRSLRVDSNFLKIFSFRVLDGDPNKTLTSPNQIAITQSTSKKLFGDDYPIGKSIEINRTTYEVTTLLSDIPSNSHLQFDVLTSYLDIPDFNWYLNYRGIAWTTYIMTHTPIENINVEKDIINAADELAMIRMEVYGLNTKASLQRLEDVHLCSAYVTHSLTVSGSKSQIILFTSIALLLFIIAVINFINLIIARSESRAREIGLRKICGAFRKQIVTQFLGESIFISLISVILSLVLAEIFLPQFGNLVEKHISLTLFTPANIIIVLLIGFITGIIAGLYPAFFLSGFTIQRAFKGSPGKKTRLGPLQTSLIVFQFAIAIFLIANVINLFRQVHYLKNKDLGFSAQTYVLTNLTPKISQGYQTVRFELENIIGVNAVSGAWGVPGGPHMLDNVYVEGNDVDNSILISRNNVHDGYLKALGIPVIKGRDFDPNLASDSAAFVLNETAVKVLGLSEPLGTRIKIHQNWGTVIGITPDYHIRSLHNEIGPLAINRTNPPPAFIYVNISADQIGAALTQIHQALKSYDPTWDVSGRFINEFFEGRYRKEEKLNKLFFASSILAIIIAIMGLFALTYFIASRRTKEVGIRKTLGANTFNLSLSMAWTITRWVVVSCLIGLPLAWYFMDKYLLNFAYRVNQDAWVFALAAISGITLALVTVISITFKIARENPIKALRYE